MSQAILQGTLLLTGAGLLMRAVSMLFQVYLSRQLGAAGLGLLQLTSSVSGLALTLGCAGLRTAAMYLTAAALGKKRPAEIRGAASCCLTAALLLGAGAGLLLMTAAGTLSAVWIRDVRAAASLRLIGLTLPVSAVSAVLSGYCTARGRLRTLVSIELAEQAASVLLTVLLLRRSAAGDLSRACLAVFGGSGAAEALGLLPLLAEYRQDLRVLPDEPAAFSFRRQLLPLCLPLYANGCLRAGLATLEHLLIPRGLEKSGESASAALAAYGTIHGMVFPSMMFASVLLSSLAEVLVPELARCAAAGRRARIRSLADRCLRFGLVFSLGAASLLLLLAAPLGLLLFRSAEAGHYLRLFAPLVPVLYLDAVVDGMHRGLGEQLFCMRCNTATSLLDILLLFLLLPRLGITGYLLSFALTHLLNFLLGLRRLFQVTGCALPLPFVLRALMLAALSAAGAGLAVPALPAGTPLALLPGVLFLLLFPSLLAFFGVFSAGDLRWALSLLRRSRAGA